MTTKRKRTTSVTRREALQTLVLGLGAIGVGRAIWGCNDTVDLPPRQTTKPKPGEENPPTDGDEYVPGDSPPVETGEEPPKVPNQVWESRVKQLESQQEVQFRNTVFTLADPGIMAGKERSHVPNASIIEEKGKKRVQVIIQHVMGKNGLDAGTAYDAGKGDGGGNGDGGGGNKDAALEAGPIEGGVEAGGGGGDAGTDAGKDAGPTGPMIEHYITTIYLRAVVNGADTVVGLWEFSSADAAPPTVKFTLPEGVTGVTAYEWCTLHGLWASALLAI